MPFNKACISNRIWIVNNLWKLFKELILDMQHNSDSSHEWNYDRIISNQIAGQSPRHTVRTLIIRQSLHGLMKGQHGLHTQHNSANGEQNHTYDGDVCLRLGKKVMQILCDSHILLTNSWPSLWCEF